jgi:ribosome assembly protein 1
LKLAPLEAYHHLSRLIEQVNAVMGSFFASDRMEDDLRWREERERRLASKKDIYADQTEATVNEADNFQEKDDEDIYFAPEKGNVIFASAIDGWGFRVSKFAQVYSAKLGFKESNLRRVLWGDFFLDPKTKKVISYKHLRGRNLKPLFVSIVLENLWAVYDAVVLNPYVSCLDAKGKDLTAPFSSNAEKVSKIVSTLNLDIPPRELKTKDTRHLLSHIFSKWLSLSTCVIQTVIDIVPAPAIAQSTRIPKMLYPDVYEQTIQPKNKLEEDLFSSKYGPDACVAAYVSKMFAVSGKDFPENKKKPMTADEMRSKAREDREGRSPDAQESDSPSLVAPGVERLSQQLPSEAPQEPKGSSEIILGFSRLYSGTIHVGTSVYCVLPKYIGSLGPTHPQNAKFVVTANVEGLYVMMGRELVSVDSVRAGNTFAIKGLEGNVWRSATLCAPNEAGTGHDPDVVTQKDCLINLGGVKRTVSLLLKTSQCMLIIFHNS